MCIYTDDQHTDLCICDWQIYTKPGTNAKEKNVKITEENSLLVYYYKHEIMFDDPCISASVHFQT